MTQRVEALANANRVRRFREQLRAELKALDKHESRAVLAEAIVECPDWLSAAYVDALLLWARRVGPETVEGWLWDAGVRGRRRLCDLSERQRLVLASLLRGERLETAA